MIAVTKTWALPVGQVYQPPRRRHGQHSRREIVLVHAQGEYRGPFYVCREVTQAEYCTWYEQEHGRAVTTWERNHDISVGRWRFYEISLD
jgi:hypothetical protein